jgi:CPA1 family monovalent cation:H+ antiporter
LAIPLSTSSGAPFPYRDFILFITFGIIVITLVGQGLLLPSVVSWLGLTRHAAEERDREQKAELAARSDALKLVQGRLEELAADNRVSPEVLEFLRTRHDYRFGGLPAELTGDDAAAAAAEVRADLIMLEREYIHRLLREGRITDEARRRIERDLDLEEAGIASKREDGVEPPL